MAPPNYERVDSLSAEEIKSLLSQARRRSAAKDPADARAFSGVVFHIDLIRDFVIVSAKSNAFPDAAEDMFIVRKQSMTDGRWDELECGSRLDFNLGEDFRGRAARLVDEPPQGMPRKRR